jgi:uncharacterized protein (DUF1015 family)
MPKIKPFNGYLVNADQAQAVVSPAYDSVSPKQRRKFAEENPHNFLNTMRLMEDFPEDSQPTQDELLELNRSNLQSLLKDGSFDYLSSSCLFLYQLDTGSHVQTGLVCEVAVDEYEQGKVRKHENTRSDKEDLLANYQKVVGASSSPICLTYARNSDIDSYISYLTNRQADLEFISEDNVTQKVWRIEDSSQQAELTRLFAAVETTYLTDGHHRAASGRRYAEIMREQSGNQGDEPYNQMLVALFPDNQLNLLPFHRCVKDLNGLSVDELLAKLEASFIVTKPGNQTSFEAHKHGEFGMFVHDTWYRLVVKPECVDKNDPVNSLDVAILQNLILDPVLGIKDMRSDCRLDYVAGVSGEQGIRQKCSEGWEVVFACYATSIDQLMDVADAGALMPPKSTYFDPKPRSGIFVRLK